MLFSKKLFLWAGFISLIVLSGCMGSSVEASQSTPSTSSAVSATVDLAVTETPISTTTTLWASPVLPTALIRSIEPALGLQVVSNFGQASLALMPISEQPSDQQLVAEANWVYVLVAPFPTMQDEASLSEIQRVWRGWGVQEGLPLMMSSETKAVFELLWGPASQNGVRVVSEDDLLAEAWQDSPSWAIIPFEKLDPRWKVLKVEGQSPLDPDLDLTLYPLVFHYGLVAQSGLDAANLIVDLPTNRDTQKMTVLVMTGTTALVRNTALRMEEEGISYPAQQILDWLKDADITHISNEVSFDPDCPPAKPLREEMRFCSAPNYIELLDTIGADVIELTGNHLLDWGPDAFRYTLDLYNQKGYSYYGGGYNLEEAQTPYRVIDHGNHLAFLGCNMMGPENDWATDDQPGSAPCDLDQMEADIHQLLDEGYLPIVTFQHFELDDYAPQSAQRIDFQRIANAGAVIVSGSQAHYPQTMTFVGDHFVHYGLGNLFFDQMFGGHEREFIDRHIFYDGRYISTELLTASLEDYAQPRPMTPEERQSLLQDVFNAAKWEVNP